jgi:hypothetical protein
LPRAKPAPARRGVRRWSAAVNARSNALDLEDGVFMMPPPEMARSLKRSALRSRRRKAPPFRSAMSMLTFYENRAGRNLSAERRRAIARAKDELRALFHRPLSGRTLTSARAARTKGPGHEDRRPRRHGSGRRRPDAGVSRAR